MLSVIQIVVMTLKPVLCSFDAGSSLACYELEVASLNGTVGRRHQVKIRSRARCSNTIEWDVQPDQWRPGTGALHLRLT